MITKSTFDVISPEDGIVAVIDRDEGMSVTNDVENVVRALAHYGHLGSGDRLIYRDTMGRWDEILHRGAEFIGFRPIGATTMNEAIDALEAGRVA